MYKDAFSLICLILFCNSIGGCQGKNNLTYQDIPFECDCDANCSEINYSIERTIRLPVKGIAYTYEIDRLFHSTNGELQYWGYDELTNGFYTFDINKQKLIDTFFIPHYGPGSLPPIWDFLVISPDSILINTNHIDKLILINNNGKLIKEWQINKPLPNGWKPELYYLASFPKFNIHMHYNALKNEALFYALLSIPNPRQTFPKEKYELPFLVSYNLATEEYADFYGNTPGSYRQDDKSSYEFHIPFAWDGSKTWVIYNKSHCMFIYHKEAQPTVVCTKSHYLPKEFEMLPFGMASKERQALYRRQGTYINILHDPYKRLLYKIVTHAQPDKNQFGLYNHKLQAPWSIMVLTEEGKCLGEMKFPREVYDFWNIKVLPEGLMISKESPFNDENEEDFLSFDLIKPILKEN